MEDGKGDIIYCALCEAEATTHTEGGTPLCSTCSQAYYMGFEANAQNTD